jgi:hypothetical protein
MANFARAISNFLGSLGGGGLWKIIDFISFFFFFYDNQILVSFLLQSGKDKRIYVFGFGSIALISISFLTSVVVIFVV